MLNSYEKIAKDIFKKPSVYIILTKEGAGNQRFHIEMERDINTFCQVIADKIVPVKFKIQVNGDKIKDFGSRGIKLELKSDNLFENFSYEISNLKNFGEFEKIEIYEEKEEKNPIAYELDKEKGILIINRLRKYINDDSKPVQINIQINPLPSPPPSNWIGRVGGITFIGFGGYFYGRALKFRTKAEDSFNRDAFEQNKNSFKNNRNYSYASIGAGAAFWGIWEFFVCRNDQPFSGNMVLIPIISKKNVGVVFNKRF